LGDIIESGKVNSNDEKLFKCSSGVKPETLATPTPNRYFTITHASSPLKGRTGQCSWILQYLIADNGKVRTSPMITILE
jgi:hypothetical protein